MNKMEDLLKEIFSRKKKKMRKYLTSKSQRNPNRNNWTNYKQAKLRPDVCLKGGKKVGINSRHYKFDKCDYYNEHDR